MQEGWWQLHGQSISLVSKGISEHPLILVMRVAEGLSLWDGYRSLASPSFLRFQSSTSRITFLHEGAPPPFCKHCGKLFLTHSLVEYLNVGERDDSVLRDLTEEETSSISLHVTSFFVCVFLMAFCFLAVCSGNV